MRRVIVVSEPYHLWRIGRLAHATGFDRAFELQYADALQNGLPWPES